MSGRFQVFAKLAGRLLAEGNVDKAISICEKGLEVYPHYKEAKLILGEAYLTKGMLAEAKGNLEEALELDQGNLRALQGLMEIAQREEDMDRAVQLSEFILQIEPSNRKAISLLEEYEREQPPGPEEISTGIERPPAEEKPINEPTEAPSLAPPEQEVRAAEKGIEEGQAIKFPQVGEPEEEVPTEEEKRPLETAPEVEEKVEEETATEPPSPEVSQAEKKGEPPLEGEKPIEVPLEEVVKAEGEVEEQPTTEPTEAPSIEEPEISSEEEGRPLEAPPEEVAGAEGEIEEKPTVQPAELSVEEPKAAKEPPPVEEAKPEEETMEAPPPLPAPHGPQEERESLEEGAEAPSLGEEEILLPKEEGGEIPPKTGEELSALGLEEGIERLESEFAGIETPTLAEIYCKQGLLEKALEVYEGLLERDPENQEYKTRIEEIKGEIEDSKDEN